MILESYDQWWKNCIMKGLHDQWWLRIAESMEERLHNVRIA